MDENQKEGPRPPDCRPRRRAGGRSKRPSAAIDREVFDQRKNASVTRRFAAHDSPARPVNYLLGRLIHCEHCGNNFVGRRREYTNHRGEKQVALTYYCGGYLFKGSAVCKSLPIDMAWIEGLVLDSIRTRLCDPDGWRALEQAVRKRIQARKQLYGADPKALTQTLTDIDRRIQNYFRAIGDGVEPEVCRQHIAELKTKREEIEKEAAVLQNEDYYTKAIENNLSALHRFRQVFDEGFQQLPFGVQRGIVLEFVSGLRVRERREIEIRLKIRIDNQGVKHLADEIDAVLSGAYTLKDESPQSELDGGLTDNVQICQPGPKWWAI